LAWFKSYLSAWLHKALTRSRAPDIAAEFRLASRLAYYQANLSPKRLQPPIAKRILAVSPHPDDEAIGCGGLLLAHAGSAEIRIVNVYNGDGGGALEEGPWRNERSYRDRLVEERAREVDVAAKAVGATRVMRLNVSDCDGQPGDAEVARLREILREFLPDLVVLPWMLDNHPHHKRTNAIFAKAAQGLDMMVIGYEIWTLLPPNAFLDISELLERKLQLVALYESQQRTIDYVGYASALARTRAFHYSVGAKRRGAAEAYIALPSRDYCDLVNGRSG